MIAERLVKGGFLREAQVNLTVSEYRSQQVSVLGAVSKPGKYPVGPTTRSLISSRRRAALPRRVRNSSP